MRGLSPHTQRGTSAGDVFARYQEASGQARRKRDKGYFLHLVNEKHVSHGVLNMTYYALKFIFQTTLKRPWEEGRCPIRKNRRGFP